VARKHSAPRGTFDILPSEEGARDLVAGHGAQLLDAAGYGRIETPTFEETELFARGLGESTDIVSKEMFSFDDRAGRSMTLRPEGTAAICRAYVEHGMHKDPQPVKLWYAGPFFRAERPQKGRYRQFNQIGAEAIGTESPLADAELIVLLDELLRGVGISELELRLASLGSPAARAAYREELRDYLSEHQAELSEQVRGRLDSNPLRAFDSDHEGTKAVMAEAPTMLERLEGEDAEHFAAVRALLDAAGIPYRLDPALVRGLDYYTRTVFEFTCPALGAQSGVGGGGRYDGLIEILGGPPTPGIGWAAGVERILLAMTEVPRAKCPEVFVVSGHGDAAFELVLGLRRHRISAQLDLAGRAFKGQMKQANRSGARFAVILEHDGTLKLREMSSGEQRAVDPAALAETVIGAREAQG
jgi:histidyl-tRNA synthetase